MLLVHLCQYATTKRRSRMKELVFSRDFSEYNTCEECTRKVLCRSFEDGSSCNQ